jgi:hypothetical protein
MAGYGWRIVNALRHETDAAERAAQIFRTDNIF